MFRIYSNRNVTEARRERAISAGNRYVNNIMATRQYARDRGNIPGNPNIEKAGNRQYARSTYMGLKNALGGGK